MKVNISNEDERIVAGWVSVEVKDLQGDIIPVEEMEKAMYKLMDRGGYVFYGHSNKPVGKILRWEVKENPETGKMGIYVVAKIFDDYKIDDEVWNRIKSGKITGFSVGGTGKQKTMVIKDIDGVEKAVKVLTDVELCEISLVEKPANPYAKIDYVNVIAKSMGAVVKGYDGNWYVVVNSDSSTEYLPVSEEIVKEMAEFNWKKYVEDIMRKLNLSDIDIGSMWIDEKVENEINEKVMKELYDGLADELYGKEYEELKPDEKYRVRRLAEIIKAYGVILGAIMKREKWFKSGIDFDKLTRQLSFEFDADDEILKETVDFLKKISECSEDNVVNVMRSYLRKVYDIVKKTDLRPPKEWIDRCIERLMEEGLDKDSASRLCGWTFYHQLSPTKPEDKDEPDSERTRKARARKRAWLRNLVEAKKMLDEVKKMEIRKEDDGCKSRYITESGRFKVMTCPDNPKKKSRFCGCVRYFMNCKGMSLEQAKRMCGYIARYVKKGVEIDGRIVEAMVELIKAESELSNFPIRMRERRGGRMRDVLAMELYGKEYGELSEEEKGKVCRLARKIRGEV